VLGLALWLTLLPRAPLSALSGASDARAVVSVAGLQDDSRLSSVSPAPADVPSQATSLESALFDLVNLDRARHGLTPVVLDAELLPIARARAGAQVSLSRLSHQDETGQLAFVTLLAEARASYRLAGENLARLHGPDDNAAARADEALMNSPSHKANILEPSFDRLAVGEARDPSGRIIFAQIFRAS
jgi:uncharacterized protein YkwD